MWVSRVFRASFAELDSFKVLVAFQTRTHTHRLLLLLLYLDLFVFSASFHIYCALIVFRLVIMGINDDEHDVVVKLCGFMGVVYVINTYNLYDLFVCMLL